MDMMEVRRRVMLSMVANGKTIILPNGNLTNTTNLDSWFAEFMPEWETEPLFIWADEPTTVNELIGCFSKYAVDTYNGLAQVWKRLSSEQKYLQNISRNGWGIKTVQGRKYKVMRIDVL
jgi:hypothetical protein